MGGAFAWPRSPSAALPRITSLLISGAQHELHEECQPPAFCTPLIDVGHFWHVCVVIVIPLLGLLPNLTIDQIDQRIIFPAVEFPIDL